MMKQVMFTAPSGPNLERRFNYNDDHDRYKTVFTSLACPITFNVEENKLAFRGDRVVTANTLALCRQDCIDRTDCVAFDFDSNNNRYV